MDSVLVRESHIFVKDKRNKGKKMEKIKENTQYSFITSKINELVKLID